jgi:hypothetical protein
MRPGVSSSLRCLPGLVRISIADVVDIDSAIHVGRRRDVLAVDGFERWVDDHIVSRLPGASHDPD